MCAAREDAERLPDSACTLKEKNRERRKDEASELASPEREKERHLGKGIDYSIGCYSRPLSPQCG